MENNKANSHSRIFLVPGNQLFPHRFIRYRKQTLYFLAEDYQACTYVQHHKHKLMLILASMRAYADGLRKVGLNVHYEQLDPALTPPQQPSYLQRLRGAVLAHGAEEIAHYEIQDKGLEARIARFAADEGLKHTVLPSPMFLCSRDDFREWLGEQASPKMTTFYKWQRTRLKILLNKDGSPNGNRWSFDEENRKALPRGFPIPGLPEPSGRENPHLAPVQRLVDQLFPANQGSTVDFKLPTTRKQALDWLKDFLEQRFTCFGDYEDALNSHSDTVFHSMMSPLMNIGLLTPDEVIDQALTYADQQEIRINNTEGFVRQILGWREFVFGIYQERGAEMKRSNFWGHHRSLTHHWYDGSTGVAPLDDVIHKAKRLGYAHHTERLMVLGNMMQLAEIAPHQAYRWFMEMFIDATPWATVPNVYSMALYADGGTIASQSYICGSNYIRKMSNYGADEWTNAVDGLFWRFVGRHREYFGTQPRLSTLPGNLDKMDAERKYRLIQHASDFLYTNTVNSDPDDRQAA
jgi:deoxyribodipyrimidine photolyase-related protein